MKKSLPAFIVLLSLASSMMAVPRERRPPMAGTPCLYSAKFDTSHSYDVRHYRLRLRLAMRNDSLRGQQTITAISRAAGLDTVMLHCTGLAVDSVKLDGAWAGFRQPDDSLLVAAGGLGWGDTFQLDIHYRGANFAANGEYSQGYYWYLRGNYPGGNALQTVGYSCSAPQDARKWMPCFDEPWDKADSGCTFEIDVPDSFATAANGFLADTVRTGDRLTWRWEEPSAIATYLMAFHASRYSFWTDTARTATGDTVPLLYFVWPADSAQSRTAFANVPGMLDCFTSRFGHYPFVKYAMAEVDPFGFGGMENQDMTTIWHGWITTNDQYGFAHELSHMWFGDMVTCGTWADIWLNEGFGTYCEAVYDEYLNGRKPGIYMSQNLYEAFTGNANSYPIYDPPMELIYDYSMEYAKGAWVLHMLRWVMGDSAFFPMMRAYADTFAYGNAVTDEFQLTAEAFHGSSLQWFFDQWVYRAGHPIYEAFVYQRTHPDSNAARISISQASTTGELYSMPVALACSSAAGREDTIIWIDSSQAGPFLMTAESAVKKVMVDPDFWLLAESECPVPSLNSVTKGPGQLTPRWSRFGDSASAPAGYNIYRSRTIGGAYLRINGEVCPDTFYVDAGLMPDSAYFYRVTAVCAADTTMETNFSNIKGNKPTGVEGGQPEERAHGRTILGPAIPCPFRSSATIEYFLPRPGRASLKIFNISGQLVRTLAEGLQPAGRHGACWDGRNQRGRRAAAGAYLAVLEAGGARMVRPLVLIK